MKEISKEFIAEENCHFGFIILSDFSFHVFFACAYFKLNFVLQNFKLKQTMSLVFFFV